MKTAVLSKGYGFDSYGSCMVRGCGACSRAVGCGERGYSTDWGSSAAHTGRSRSARGHTYHAFHAYMHRDV